MKKITALGLSLCAIGCLSSISAMEFQTLGYKANAMGGTGVSNPAEGMAIYFNPAMLAFNKSSVSIDLGVGVSAEDRGLMASADALDKTGFSSVIDKAGLDVTTLTTTDIANITKATGIISGMNGNSVSITPGVNFGVNIGSFSIGLMGYGELSGTTVVDPTRTSLLFQNGSNYYDINGNSVSQATYDNTSLEYAINNGLTRFDLNGIVIAEIPVGYGKAFDTSFGKVAVGGALKYMRGQTSFNQINLKNYNDITKNLNDNTKDSYTYGIDLGLAYKPSFNQNITVGFVGKDLNTPKFDTAIGSYKVDPMSRIGISYDLWDEVAFAVDYDITKNKSLTDGFNSQYIGAGIDYHKFSWVDIKAGLKTNLAESNTGTIYTAGLGFGPKAFHIEVAGEISGKQNTVSESKYPAYANGTISLVSNF